VAAAPVLTARLVEIPGLRVPRQEPAPLTRATLQMGRESLAAGTLRVDITPVASGAQLTLTCHTTFIDAASVGLLFAAVADSLAGRVPLVAHPDFFEVAAGHSAMARSGELTEEAAFWADDAMRMPQDALSLSDAIPVTGSIGATSARLDWRAAETLAAQAGATVADLAHLALDAVVRRIGLPAQTVGVTVDTRALMGLPEVAGPLTQVVPTAWRLESTEDVVTALKARAEQRDQTASMVGGPALAQVDERPAVVLDGTGGPILPPEWTMIHWSYPIDGQVTLGVHRGGDELVLRAESAEGNGRSAILLSMWAAMLAGTLEHPEKPLAGIPLVTQGQAADIVRRLTREDLPAPSLLERFSTFLAMNPESPAVRHGDVTTDYRQLAARVNDFVVALDGLSTGAVVAVVGDHEADVIAAMLAALWLGATFLPLSREEPEERLRDALLRSSASAVLLGTDSQVPEVPGCRVVVLREVPKGGDPLPPAATADPASHAYLLRTSGSTGAPKLVGIRRSSVDNYLRWTTDHCLSGDAWMPVLSSPIFDASLKQTLGVLYAGGCVWIPSADRRDTTAMRAELSAAGVPLALNCVPSYLSALLAEEDGPPLSVRRFLCGGEPLKPALVSRMRIGWPDAEVWNLYGPTEATATATAGQVTAEGPVTVGTPIAGAGVITVDEGGHVLPPGVRGELAITGPGLATGYLSGHEGPSPFVRLDVGGHKIPAYRTGDLGWVSPSGVVTVLGRTDNQIKVNGWRIELGEIEAAAQAVPGVVDAVAVLDDRSDVPRLRLFVTGDVDGPTVAESLRAVLPAPMVPGSVIARDRFDTTTTGKVDRKALLRHAESVDQPAPDDYDPVELEVATVWREAVCQGWPRRDDDFFSVGGHSLLLARVVNVLRARGYEQLSLRKVVQRPTVSSIAEAIRSAESSM
jgi:amino acid adenylation domain-containing protein